MPIPSIRSNAATGCIGAVTNGCVRDLDEVRALGFHFFATGACVSHAYVHLMDFGCPVNVGGILVKTGDLIHADGTETAGEKGPLCRRKDALRLADRGFAALDDAFDYACHRCSYITPLDTV